MQRLLISTAMLGMALLAGAPAQAQTTIKITMPDSSSCVYPTGPVSSNATAGQLQATATAAGTGAGCTPEGAVGAVSFGPASPLSPASVGPLTSVSSGESATLTFQAVNATQCTGSITGAAGGTFTTPSPFCTSAASCAAQQTIGVSLPYNSDTVNTKTYSVAVTCSAGIQSAISTSTVIVNKAGGGGSGACTKTIQGSNGVTSYTSAGPTIPVNYYSNGTGNVDPSSFAAIFKSAWPGTGHFGLLVTMTLDNNKYVSAQFTTPLSYFSAPNVPLNLFGQYTMGETDASAPASMTISESCGDFANPLTGSSVVPGCYVNAIGTSAYLSWSNGFNGAKCILQDNHTYYLNIINANISNLTPSGGTAASTKNSKCLGGHCTVPLQNGGNWSGYVPN